MVRAVALEACNLGATVAAGAEVALAGEASASHTAGVKKALRQVCLQGLVGLVHWRGPGPGPGCGPSMPGCS